MSSNKLVSIVIPLYNVEDYVEKCIRSVLNQTFQDFEAIIINDGSPDKSVDIARELVNNDSRFKIIDQENKGLGGARNTGIDAASSKYIISIDSDDWLHPEFLERLVDTAERNSSDIVICGIENVYENREVKIQPLEAHNEHLITSSEKAEFLRTVRYVSWNKLIRTDLFSDIRFPEHMSKQDYATIPRILAKANKIVCINEKLYFYLWREGSVTNSIKVNRNILKAQQMLENSELNETMPELLQVYFVRNVMGSLIWSMLKENEDYLCEISDILENERRRYPNFDRFIVNKYIGAHKKIYGKMLFHSHYRLAKMYVIFYSYLQRVGKQIKRLLFLIRR